eukprot:1056576-Alexandrium_andersonii.AAC.1
MQCQCQCLRLCPWPLQMQHSMASKLLPSSCRQRITTTPQMKHFGLSLIASRAQASGRWYHRAASPLSSLRGSLR